MTQQTNSPKFSPEVRERAVRMVLDHTGDYPSQWAAIASIAAKIGCTAQTLSNWVRQAERDQGKRPGTTTDERERLKLLELGHRLIEEWRLDYNGEWPHTSLNGLTPNEFASRSSEDHNPNGVYL